MFEDSTHGGRQRNRAGLWGRIISTHALTEGDCHPPERRTLLMKFQLTPSRRATINLPPLALRSLISTHALTEGDSIGYFFLRTKRYFNSRPHGGRPIFSDNLAFTSSFQLTPSRRATCQSGIRLLCCNISTHALTEGDEKRFRPCPSMGISTHALTEGDFRFLQCGFNCV